MPWRLFPGNAKPRATFERPRRRRKLKYRLGDDAYHVLYWLPCVATLLEFECTS